VIFNSVAVMSRLTLRSNVGSSNFSLEVKVLKTVLREAAF
jgi:hypothetical protein